MGYMGCPGPGGHGRMSGGAWRTSWEAMEQAMLVKRSVAQGLVLRGKRNKEDADGGEMLGLE